MCRPYCKCAKRCSGSAIHFHAPHVKDNCTSAIGGITLAECSVPVLGNCNSAQRLRNLTRILYIAVHGVHTRHVALSDSVLPFGNRYVVRQLMPSCAVWSSSRHHTNHVGMMQALASMRISWLFTAVELRGPTRQLTSAIFFFTVEPYDLSQ